MLSLRNYLILMLVLVAAVPLALFWAWPHSSALTSEIGEVKDRHLLIARNLGTALQRYHRDAVSTFEYSAGALLSGQPVPAARTLLENLRFTRICVFDAASGRSIAGQSVSRFCPAILQEARRAELERTAPESRTLTTPVHASEDGTPTVTLLRRFGSRIVTGDLETSHFRELGKAIAFGINGHAVIVDGAGRLLSHPLAAWEAQMRDLSGVSAVRRMLAGEQGVDTFYSPALKEKMIAGFAPVAGPGWGVMVSQPVAELRAKASQLNASALSVIAIGVLLAALAACRLAVMLARPVERASAAARRVAQGDLGARIEVSGRFVPTELNALTQSFNEMTRSVREARLAEAAARSAAETASDSKSRFLRTVTHELRSPLNAIIGFAELLSSDRCGPPGSAQYRKVTKDIAAGSRHLLALTNDLLDLARIEAGQYDLAEETFGIDEIAARAVRYVEVEAQRRGSSVRLAIDEPPPLIRGDERALFQVLLNLTSNAVRYGKPGGAVLVTARRLADDGLEIVVADDGPGIAPEDLPRVLQPFQRASTAAARDVGGTGLGLPIVVQLIKLHGGTFELQSELGHGTRARIVLPRHRVIDADESALRSAA